MHTCTDIQVLVGACTILVVDQSGFDLMLGS